MTTQPAAGTLLDLREKTAVVTGGAMGIGRAVAERLGQCGASVVIADEDAMACALTAKELGQHGFEVTGVPTDVSEPDDVRHLVRSAVQAYGAVDILVNNAGIFPRMPVLEMSEDDFRRVVDVNLIGLFLCSRAVAKQMVEQGRGGRIVNVTSIDALHPSSIGLAHYDASKHGAWGFTKNLALELAPHHIWVNAVAPGAIATPGVARMSSGGEAEEEVLRRFLERVPMGRMGQADDIAKVVLFLASDLATYLTGSQVVADGGVLLT